MGEIVFAKAITPDFCICSVPEGFSIIAPQDTRAIDLPVCEFQLRIFDENKGRMKFLLGPKMNMSNDELKEAVRKYYGGRYAEIIDLNSMVPPKNTLLNFNC